MSELPPPSAPEAKRPFWKNPFFLGFVVGAVLLTILPFFQRQRLSAPPPLAKLSEWSLSGAGGSLGSKELAGKVWIATFCTAPCQPAIPLSQVAMHVEKQHVEAVTVVIPGGQGEVPSSSAPNWKIVSGTPEQVDAFAAAFREAYSRQSGSPPPATAQALAAQPMFALVDQEGAIRGFWPGDELGKGNVINAAQMIVRYGPRP